MTEFLTNNYSITKLGWLGNNIKLIDENKTAKLFPLRGMKGLMEVRKIYKDELKKELLLEIVFNPDKKIFLNPQDYIYRIKNIRTAENLGELKKNNKKIIDRTWGLFTNSGEEIGSLSKVHDFRNFLNDFFFILELITFGILSTLLKIIILAIWPKAFQIHYVIKNKDGKVIANIYRNNGFKKSTLKVKTTHLAKPEFSGSILLAAFMSFDLLCSFYPGNTA